MRTIIKTLAQKFAIEYTGLAVAVLAVLTIPISAFAWGPSRTTFTMQSPATYVTFNSITDNPSFGDERNFSKIKEAGASDSSYSDTANLAGGKEYQMFIFYHNNAASNFNASGQGVAQGAYARTSLPVVVKNNSQAQAENYVGASNANPTSVYDEVTFKNATGGDIALRYVPGSTKIHNFGKTDGQTMPDTIIDTSGVKLGYDSLNGTLPGCNDYAGYITYLVKAEQPNFTFSKQVRMHGTKQWSENVMAKPGDQVDFLLSYENTGSTEQKDVVFKDTIPKGLTYVKGSSKLQNGNYPSGSTVGDSISGGGINVGTYEPTANGYLAFTTTVNSDDPCSTLTNVAAVETENGSEQDTASVGVSTGNCTPAETLPTTGPVEFVAAVIGLAAITIGMVYYFKSRRELQQALHHAQSQPTLTSTKLVSKSDYKEHAHEAADERKDK